MQTNVDRDSDAGPVRSRGRWHRIAQILIVATMLAGMVGVIGPTPSADASSHCVGSKSQKLKEARVFFEEYCGTDYNDRDSKFKCNYKSSGWECSGPRSDLWYIYSCVGEDLQIGHQQSYDAAKRQYKHVCKETWNGSSGKHHCKWIDKGKWSPSNTGWRCWKFGR